VSNDYKGRRQERIVLGFPGDVGVIVSVIGDYLGRGQERINAYFIEPPRAVTSIY
jgi:hypothetical protein